MSVPRKIAAALAVLTFVMAGCGGDEELAADAGDDFQVAVGDSPRFDGCGSTGSIDTYSWVITVAPEAMKLDDTECAFELEAAMGLVEVGTWVIELTVADGETVSTDDVTVVVVDG